METSSIIDRLTTTNGLPRAALLTASKHKKELAPLFIAEVDKYISENETDRPTADAVFFMFHLLGDWRETSAYRTLALFLQNERARLVLGGGVTETSHRVMASVFDGDPQPIYDIIHDPDTDEFIRSNMCETLAMLVVLNKLDRAKTAIFLRDCFTTLQPQENCYVWQGWQAAIAKLGLEELTPMVEEAFRRQYIDPMDCNFNDFQEDLGLALATPGAAIRPKDENCTLFGDTIEELSWWHCFSEEYQQYQREHKQERRENALTQLKGEQAANPHKNVGRNDPCPCGSGKKFKKCCLH
jgi:hypothetical protein